MLTPEIIDEAHPHGFSMWTLNKLDEMRRVIEMGVDAIMIDRAANVICFECINFIHGGWND